MHPSPPRCCVVPSWGQAHQSLGLAPADSLCDRSESWQVPSTEMLPSKPGTGVSLLAETCLALEVTSSQG